MRTLLSMDGAHVNVQRVVRLAVPREALGVRTRGYAPPDFAELPTGGGQ